MRICDVCDRDGQRTEAESGLLVELKAGEGSTIGHGRIDVCRNCREMTEAAVKFVLGASRSNLKSLADGGMPVDLVHRSPHVTVTESDQRAVDLLITIVERNFNRTRDRLRHALGIQSGGE